MRRWLVICVGLLCACRPEKIGGGDGDLTFGTDRVVFPMTVVGYSTLASVEVRNNGRYTRSVTLKTKAPFALRTEAFELPGGSSVRAEITFSPQSPGSAELPLSLESEEQKSEATLVGPAELPPPCDETGPCWHQVYDHPSGSCVKVNSSDGSACAGGTACFSTSECREGECVGTPIVCDDGNRCTTNACDPNTGCVFFSSVAQCAASEDPCLAPACDPMIGCTYTEVEDGTSCGSSDCSNAKICLLGKCKEVPVFDGAACGSESPCQARGLCVATTCVRPNEAELIPAWTVRAPPGSYVIWDSIADKAGNVYWRETPNWQGGTLRSVTSAGFNRFAVGITILSGQMSLIEDTLVLHAAGTLEAHHTGDGKVKWTRTFPLEAGVYRNEIRAVARGNAGVMYANYVKVKAIDGAEVVLGSSVVALDLATGATQWETKIPAQSVDFQSFPVDEQGYLYFGTTGTDGIRRFHSLTPQGVKRWLVAPNPHASPAAVFGGHAYHWDHWISDTGTGNWVNTKAPTLNQAGYPRLALGAISFVGTTVEDVPDCTDGGVRQGLTMQLTRVDPSTSALIWSKTIASGAEGGLNITNTVLTSKNSVLFSQPATYCGPARHKLREISALGEPTFSCQLPGTESYEGEGLLNDKRWVVKIREQTTDGGIFEGVRAIALPGFELPAHGWATAEGSPGRDNHAR